MKQIIRSSGFSLIYEALLLLILPFPWLISALTAACFHEICHYAAVRYTGGKVLDIEFSCRGIIMETTELSVFQELFCALAGPVGSILLFCSYPAMPRIAICAGIQALFNLLPIYPQDGGRIFRCIITLIVPRYASAICFWTEYALIIGILLIFPYLLFHNKVEAWTVFVLSILLSRVFAEKFLAKRGN